MADTVCKVCYQTILPYQDSVTCDVCHQCQHQTCSIGFTGVSNHHSTGEQLQNVVKVYSICNSCEENNWPEPKPYQFHPAPVEQRQLKSAEKTDPLDISFDINADLHYGDRQEEVHHSEDTEAVLSDQVQTDAPVTFKLLEKGSTRGHPLLVSSNGYSYVVKRQNKTSTSWRCSVRSKKITCPATISQHHNSFRSGSKCHNHPKDYALPVKAVVSAQVKEKILQHPSIPAMHVVAHVVSTIPDDLLFLTPSLDNLKRTANRHRAIACAKQPAESTKELTYL